MSRYPYHRKKGPAPRKPLRSLRELSAAQLRLNIKPGKYPGDGCTVESQEPGITGCTAFYDDESQQMRRAIVVVAANTGKAKA